MLIAIAIGEEILELGVIFDRDAIEVHFQTHSTL